MAVRKILYLAGPDVFLPNAAETGRAKVALCDEYGFDGRFPLDAEIEDTRDRAYAIYCANADLMERADAILANVTPFRGISADVGTAFEMGWFAGRGRPVFAYTASEESFAARATAALRVPLDADRDHASLAIEQFGLWDNLMLPGAVRQTGADWVATASPDLVALAAFTTCLARVHSFFDDRNRLSRFNMGN